MCWVETLYIRPHGVTNSEGHNRHDLFILCSLTLFEGRIYKTQKSFSLLDYEVRTQHETSLQYPLFTGEIRASTSDRAVHHYDRNSDRQTKRNRAYPHSCNCVAPTILVLNSLFTVPVRISDRFTHGRFLNLFRHSVVLLWTGGQYITIQPSYVQHTRQYTVNKFRKYLVTSVLHGKEASH
jgi:hypothetical protein